MLRDSLALQAAEKSFYDVFGQKYPPLPNQSSNDRQGDFESSNLQISLLESTFDTHLFQNSISEIH